jgi:hypothetical protein
MNAKRILLLLGTIVLAAALFFAGTAFAQSGWGNGDGECAGAGPNGWGHMSGWDGEAGEFHGRYGGMMGEYAGPWGDAGAMHGGMMGGGGGLADPEPLSIEDAEQGVAEFLAGLDEDGLAVGEVMIFSNHAYAQVVDAAGAGAFEVLVDPARGNVYPEPGPNMMWNTAYGHMGGGMMGEYGTGSFADNGDEATVAPAAAVAAAQSWLDEFLPGATADEHADAFPGYYTLHVLRDGEIAGMLSVNAFSGDVFPHTWHGEFVEMAAGHAD